MTTANIIQLDTILEYKALPKHSRGRRILEDIAKRERTKQIIAEVAEREVQRALDAWAVEFPTSFLAGDL